MMTLLPIVGIAIVILTVVLWETFSGNNSDG
jgi:hypothetical protein